MSVLVAIKNIGIEGGATLPPPYSGIIKLGGEIVVSDTDVPTVIANLGGASAIQGILSVSLANNASAATPNSAFAAMAAALIAAVTQTITGVWTFAAGSLKLFNAEKTFAATFVAPVTAARTITFPDASATLAQEGVASGTAAPAVTGVANEITAGTGTSTGGVTTLSGGTSAVAAVGSVAYAAHALNGAIVSDGTITAVVLDNTAIGTTTATGTTINSGTITTSVPLSATITATLVVTQLAAASHSHVQS